MKSIIEWQTDIPNIEGEYLVIDDNEDVTVDRWCILEHRQFWERHGYDEVVAWCKVSEIKPFKGIILL